MLTDTHVHLDQSEYAADLSQVLARSRAAGVTRWIVPAIAFAWLAKSFLQGRAGNLSAVTGANRQAILGCFHPAA